MIARTEFDATDVSTQEEDGVLLVGFANNTGQYILFQRSVSPSAEDIKLGHDQVHFERNDQRHSAYGGINQYTLTGSKLILQLAPQAAQKIGIEPTLEVRFTVTDDQFQVLKRKLEQIFARVLLTG